MSASKITYLHGFPAFPCTISLSKGHFPDHIGLVLGQKPDTNCRIPRKLFFVFGHKKSRDAGMHPGHTPYSCCLIWPLPASMWFLLSFSAVSPPFDAEGFSRFPLPGTEEDTPVSGEYPHTGLPKSVLTGAETGGKENRSLICEARIPHSRSTP